MTTPARTIFLGSGSFAVPVAAALAEHPSAELLAVVTAPTRPGSRGRPTAPPVAVWAARERIAILQPVRLRAPESIAEIVALRPELVVLADYGQIVPAGLLDLPSHGALNLHPSLLPRHRGASPISAAILAGDTRTGVTLMQMDAGLDTGPVVAQTHRVLSGSETAPELEEELAELAAGLVRANLRPWLDGELQAVPQEPVGATLTRPLRRADGRLDPSLSIALLERQVRAYQPWPGSFVETADGRIVVWRAVPRDTDADAVEPSGTLTTLAGGGLGLVVADGVLDLVEVQAAGGRRMSGAELVRGRPRLAGARVISPQPVASAEPK